MARKRKNALMGDEIGLPVEMAGMDGLRPKTSYGKVLMGKTTGRGVRKTTGVKSTKRAGVGGAPGSKKGVMSAWVTNRNNRKLKMKKY